MNMDAQLQALLDKQAIAEVLQRYSRTLDWLDDEGQAGCFWPDAHIDYGFFTGSAADFLPVVMQIERASQRRWHFLSTPSIALHSSDRASVECYGFATGIREQDDGTWSGGLYGGRYLDEFEKRDGEWRIASRRYIMDWKLPLEDQPGNEPNPDFPLPVLQIIASGHPDYRVM
ncbi:nuclear transport factor 2 family protein [Erythrobacter dokdonensis]|uniref:Gamma-hexachlorocyclohexane dehydrochlorinase n=1 Tax=Erythrobacter dokdonensis DSW-74 TaxID=1300349 RepID=A0A1A7BDM1_9SPHN|nr:nuclear transport factor 2 family protein [Erythrobacter dokdonensis]OBV10633.1 Gamma-hexachlorocyclohexane dehydrochlorinase [Erythrobacter dokdonensis DSW-74]